MLTLEFQIEGISPYSQSKYTGERPSDTGAQAWEEQTWRERMHRDKDGHLYLPVMSIKYAMVEAARASGDKIKGRGHATWTKKVEHGVLPDPYWYVYVNGKQLHYEDVEGERLLLHANGNRNSGTRVERIMPCIPAGWSATVVLQIIAPELIENPERVLRYLTLAGQFIGIGRWRPENGGVYGRFSVVKSNVDSSEKQVA